MASPQSTSSRTGIPDEAVSAENIHLVERPDLRHAIVDVAVWRTGRPGRAGQSLLSQQGPQDRSDARFRAALGGLYRLCRSEPGAAVMAWLAASHRRRRADRRDVHAARVGKAARPEPDRHARGLSSVRLDTGARPPTRRHRRLPALDAGKLIHVHYD